MECNLTKIYEYFGNLQFPKPEFDKLERIIPDPIIAKNSRYIGVAFDALIKNHLLLIHGEKSYDGPYFYIYSKVQSKEISVDKIYCRDSKFNSVYRKLKNEKQIFELDYSELLARSVIDIEERKKCAEHIQKLISNFKFEHFLPEQRLISNFTPEMNMNGKRKFRIAILEIIKDNEIIEIKSDVQFEGIKPEYISQICFYYFVIKWLHRYDHEIKKSILYNVNPSVLSIYYAYHNYLYQIDPSIIFKDEERILDLFDQEILEGNNLIQEVISLAISTKKSEMKLKKLFSKIERRKLQLIQELVETHLHNNDGEIARELMNRFSYKLESYKYIKFDSNEFLEISSNYSHLENRLKLWEMLAPQREFKKTMMGLTNIVYSEATYNTMINSFLPLIVGSQYTYGYSYGNKSGILDLTIESFKLNFSYMNNYQPLKFKYFKVNNSEIDYYTMDFSMDYFIEDRYKFYALSGSIICEDCDEESIVSRFQVPFINTLPIRSLPVQNSLFNLKSNELGERIWKFVGYEKLNIENKEYKNCAKFIISDELGETTKLWFKKGIGMVRKEYPTGRIEWLIDFKIPKK